MTKEDVKSFIDSKLKEIEVFITENSCDDLDISFISACIVTSSNKVLDGRIEETGRTLVTFGTADGLAKGFLHIVDNNNSNMKVIKIASAMIKIKSQFEHSSQITREEADAFINKSN